MSHLVTVDETKYNVSQLAKQQGAAFSQVIGTSQKVASKKLRSFVMAMLSKMDVGDEQKFPIPSMRGARRSFILKKVGDEDFVIQVVEKR